MLWAQHSILAPRPVLVSEDRSRTIVTLARNARIASRALASSSGGLRSQALLKVAAGLRAAEATILAANKLDLEAGRKKGLEPSFLDRLALNEDRLEGMARAVEEVAAQTDPVGRVDSEIIRPNGLRVAKMRIPLGVVAVIYEARPNVTSDAAALALRSGNAVILKGGSDAQRSNEAIGKVVRAAIAEAGLPEDSVTVLTARQRSDIADMLQLDEFIDVVIPRGGEALIRFVTENSRIPVIKHYKGVCHMFLDATAELDIAVNLAVNSKASRPSACNSLETLLVHADAAERLLPAIGEAMRQVEVTMHACERSFALLGGNEAGDSSVVPATEEDWHAEYLSLDLAVRVVDSIGDAIAHITTYASDHTEAIITREVRSVDRFVSEIQSSCVMVNTSTRFADGGELGLGAEIGISTSKLHAYGPMGADELTTTRFVVRGDGHLR